MAKISDMTALSAEPASGDLFTIVDVSEADAANKNKKIAYSTLKTGITTSLDSRVTAVEGDITTIQGDITTIEGDISDVESDITTLDGRIDTLEAENDVFVSNGDGGPYVSGTSLNIPSSISDSSWKSIGPTDAGCDVTWTALDNIPTDVFWIEVKILCAVTRTSTAANVFVNYYATSFESNVSEGVSTNIFKMVGRCAAGEYLSSSGVHKIPVNSRKFYFYRDINDSDDTTSTMWLIGYGFN